MDKTTSRRMKWKKLITAIHQRRWIFQRNSKPGNKEHYKILTGGKFPLAKVRVFKKPVLKIRFQNWGQGPKISRFENRILIELKKGDYQIYLLLYYYIVIILTIHSFSDNNCRSPPITLKRSKEPNQNADVCLRPSLIKAAQRNIKFNVKNCVENLHRQNQGITDHRRSKSSDVNPCLEDNLKIIKHRDSMSILMDKFRKLNNNRMNCNRGIECSKNLDEVNLILGDEKRFDKSKQPLRRSHDLTSRKIHRHRETHSSPVTNQSINSFENNYDESTEHLPSRKIISRSAGTNMATKFENGINGTLGMNKARLKNLKGVC